MAAKEPKPKRGRPPTGQTPKRYFRMEDDAWEAVQQAAKAREQTASDFIRATLLRAAKRSG